MNDLNNMPDADDVEEEEMADIVDDEENSYSQRRGERKIIKSEFKHEGKLASCKAFLRDNILTFCN